MNAAALALSAEEVDVSVPSALLGTLELRTSQVFSFEHGLLGFPQARAFALVPSRLEGLFWLQSLDFEALTFLLADPFPLVDGYSLELGPQEVPWSDATDSSRFLVLAIVTLPREPGRTATANLQGPLAFDLVQRRGRQIVLQHSPFGVRHPVDLGQGGHA